MVSECLDCGLMYLFYDNLWLIVDLITSVGALLRIRSFLNSFSLHVVLDYFYESLIAIRSLL